MKEGKKSVNALSFCFPHEALEGVQPTAILRRKQTESASGRASAGQAAAGAAALTHVDGPRVSFHHGLRPSSLELNRTYGFDFFFPLLFKR